MARTRSTPKAAKPGQPYKLYPVEKIKPLDPDKPLMPTRLTEPGHAKFKDIPGQLTLDDMGAIELPGEEAEDD